MKFLGFATQEESHSTRIIKLSHPACLAFFHEGAEMQSQAKTAAAFEVPDRFEEPLDFAIHLVRLYSNLSIGVYGAFNKCDSCGKKIMRAIPVPREGDGYLRKDSEDYPKELVYHDYYECVEKKKKYEQQVEEIIDVANKIHKEYTKSKEQLEKEGYSSGEIKAYSHSYTLIVPKRKIFLIDMLKCDCGGEKARTTHADWCSTNE